MSYQRLISDLQGLLQPERQQGLPVVARRGVRAGKRVSVPYVAPPRGTGIASPLVEKTRIEDGVAVPDREYYEDEETVITSTDGLLSFVFKPIKKTTFTDANGDDEEREYARPV